MENSLDVMREHAKIPGISIATVTANGKITTSTSGVINNDTQQAVNDETIFEAASLSKPVFAYIVLKMVERGQLNLDTPLCDLGLGDFGPPFETIRHPEKFNETFAQNYKKLTPRLILSHQAGLPNEFDPNKLETFAYVSPVGEQFNYSGEAYRFLREIIERIATPDSLEELAKREFTALGMNHTSFIMPKDCTNQSVGHFSDGSVDTRPHFFGIHPAASLYTTAADYGKFLQAFADTANKEVRKLMFEPALLDLSGKDSKAIEANVSDDVLKQIGWGVGIGLQKNKDGSMVAFHWGDGNNTCRNFAALNLTTNQAVVCLTNSENGPTVFKKIAEPIVGDLSPVCQWLFPREKFTLDTTLASNATQGYKKI